ncbi:MAG: VWA domain-containing protein [Chromatiaceae bacterium]|nr:VWA domain-containing protein [Chromatiaceae bacterium]
MPFDLHFLRPLWFLALLPLPWLLWRLARANPGAEAWRGLVDAHLLAHLLVEEGARVRRLPRVLLTLGWLLGVMALAGPVWDRLPEPLYQAQAQRVIVLDLSPDMDAQDLTPSRLTRARFEILDLLAAAAEGETALLAYGAEPFVVSPLTQDAATIAAQVPDLETALLPVRGPKRTDLALEAAGEMLKRSGSPEGDIILVTADPERPEAVRSQVARLRDQGYRTSVLGLGTEKGAPVPRAEGGFQADAQGGIRLSRLQPDLLAEIAAAGGGRYVPLAADESDTRALLPEARLDVTGRELAAEARKDIQADQWREEGPWLLLALLPLAALAFRRGWLSPLVLLVFFLPPPPAEALGWADLWWRADQQGAQALAAGDPHQAAERFSRPDWRAAAQYESGEYDQTLETLKDQTGAEAAYNRGNALARAGKLEEAITEYDRALVEAPGHADAQYNRELLQRLWDQQPPPPSSESESKEGDQAQDGQAGGNSQNQEGKQGQKGQQDQQGDSGGQDSQDQQDPQGQQGPGDPQDQKGQPEGQAGGQDSRGQGQDAQGGQPQAQDPASAKGQAVADQRQEGAPSGPGDPQESEASQEALQAGQSAQPKSPDGDKPGEGAADVSPEEASPEPRGQDDAQASAAPSNKDGPLGQQPDQARPGAEPGKHDLLGGQEPGPPPGGKPNPQAQAPASEGEQAMEHQLRRVLDDPGGLLRQRFMLQHLRRQGQLP